MCGILGYLSPESASQEAFIASRDRLVHRGPDDAGVWQNTDGTVMLGHRRLAILDLSAAGHQPMASDCGRYTIVYNGEVYNYLELKKELESLGWGFRGSGDTEVILAAYRLWGEVCLHRFNGMFAFAIWDNGDGQTPPTLFLARDRAGKKPLYYAHAGRKFAFASELKAIPKSMLGSIDLQALNHYLALGYVPGSLCIAEGGNKLPPAHAARFRADTGELKVWRWWALPEYRPSPAAKVEELVEEADALLREAVRLRMRSDVPIGVLLSGGLDSSLIAACAAQVASRPIMTFTMGQPGSGLDETHYAAVVARHVNTDHHVLELSRPSLDVLDELAPYVDEPIADSSIIPTYLVSKLTAQHVKVALGGDGGDELFGGYGDYTKAFADEARMGWVPAPIMRGVAALAGRLPTGVRGRNRLYALKGGPFQSLVWGSPYFDAVARKRIMPADAVEALGASFMAPELFRVQLFQEGKAPVDAMTRTHFGSILPDDFLFKVDRASMAVSLEMRAPFLDKALVEFAFSRIPSEWKVRGTQGRRLEKLLAKKYLPPELDVNRKQGFSIPMDEWLRNAEAWRIDSIGQRLAPWINAAELARLRLGQQAGRQNGSRLFALIMLATSIDNLLK
ncbi:MAG: asparagine synthase (glutamine-hydrolyzing) [Gallionella sp.]|nr:asparagine synthase (glutamine-hydrolyzing) [Gallionella sp.]